MKILETVIGSNQRFIQDQTVGKKEGAPTIYAKISMASQKMLWESTQGKELMKDEAGRRTNMRSSVSG